MLEMRPDCERCGKDVSAHEQGAHICSFECTFCFDCSKGALSGTCPNCGGPLHLRPPRPEALLAKFPASTDRKYKRNA